MNLGANGMNQTFKTGIEPKAPYYYITASLDLAGCTNGTYYFNQENSLAYANDPNFSKFIIVNENVVISEVTVYTNPAVVLEDEVNECSFTIGGAANHSTSPVIVPWAAPAGTAPGVPPAFAGESLTAEELNAGSINYFGHEGGHFPYFYDGSGDDPSSEYRFLAITIDSDLDYAGLNEKLVARSRRRARARGLRSLPSGPAVVAEGRVSVVLKVYPKDQ
jgi:hypothetical protein